MKIKLIDKILLLPLLVFGLSGLLRAQPKVDKKYSIVDPKGRYGGISLLQSNHGSGLGFFYEHARKNADRLSAEIDFLVVKGYADYPMYEYYGDYVYVYERSDRRRLTLMPVYLGYKKILFTDKIANNFRPFGELSGGLVVGIDPPNIPDFSDRIKRIRFHYAPGFRLGAGVEFFYGPSTTLALFVGYQFIRFAHKIDRPDSAILTYYSELGFAPTNLYQGQRNFQSMIVKISFGKRY